MTAHAILEPRRVFRKDTVLDGRDARIRCMEIGGRVFSMTRGPVSVARLEDEWYEDLADPYTAIGQLKDCKGFRPDLLTFWQRLPSVEPTWPFHLEWEEIAVLSIESYERWWSMQLRPRVRTLIRKAERDGVLVKPARYDDDFVRGMVAIFNETPVRQGRRFWHYGKDFETVKRQFSRFLYREELIGAYLDGEMVGFMMLGDAGRFALTGQLLSSIRHRDKAISNALIASAVKSCTVREIPWLAYFYWSDDSLAEFKRRCGFEKMRVPRYYVPLTRIGELALRVRAHRGLRNMLPRQARRTLKQLAAHWYVKAAPAANRSSEPTAKGD